MTWAPERSTVNQKIQLGVESTSALGTSVAANKSILCFDFQAGISTTLAPFQATGHKYISVQELNQEWTDITISGMGDYNGLIYLFASAMGAVAPVASGSSTTAKDWVYSPPLSGSIVPQTYTIEQGDSVRAHKYSYGLVTQIGYKFDPTSYAVSGKMIAQRISDGITMTASPTAVALAPIVASQVDVYCDSSQETIGTTKLTKFMSGEFSMDNIYGPAWFVNSSNASFAAHVDLVPKPTFKMTLEGDAVGMGFLENVRSGDTAYIRVVATGPEIDADNSINYTFQHDMAVKFGKIDPFNDGAGIFQTGYECTLAEDSTWGHAQQVTLTNLLTAL